MQIKDYSENYGEGWIKLYRSIRKHWIHRNPNYFRAWCDILMETNHEPNKDLIGGQLIDCDRGQKIYSLQTWKKVFGEGWSIQKVRTFFKLLEKDNMIITEGLKNTTRLTVLNYKTYQDKVTSSQHSSNKHLTSIQQAANNNIRSKRIKELKNDKNGRFTPPTPQQVEEYGRTIKFNIDGEHFCSYYETRGWFLSKGVKMKSWKSAITTWKKNRANKDDGDEPYTKDGVTYV